MVKWSKNVFVILKKGNAHGEGTYYYKDGGKYTGKLKKGKKHGQGAYIWSNGTKSIIGKVEK